MLSIRDLPPHHFCVTVSLLGFYIQALTRFVFPFFFGGSSCPREGLAVQGFAELKG